ncbi:MAG TPA: TerC family protein [Gemmatimonadales bacterium]|jgi:TerC family integral membrane protein|nr:TerC family protein [Gemmatimonadales bacterium]
MGHHGLVVWVGFSIMVVVLMALDLGVLNRRAHVLSLKEALAWSGSWIALAFLFGLFLLFKETPRHALEYYTGYLIELSLSVDNLFVFILVFQYFRVPAELQPRVLKWGIIGAVIMRFVMIVTGALLLQRFAWVIYVFGAIVIFTGIKMMRAADIAIDLKRNPVVRIARRFLPFSDSFDGQHFFTRENARRLATPLFLVLLVIETTDLLFAVDSIPAIFAITRDPFIVYTSNVFAILGLRSMFFILAGMLDRFEYLKPAVAVILIFVGLKMLLSEWVHLPISVSLGVIIALLVAGIVLSLLRTRRTTT